MIPVSQFQGINGALIVSMIAFSIVFIVLSGLCAIIFVNRYIAMSVGKKNSAAKTAPAKEKPAVPAVSAASVSAPVSDDKDMKKIVAAISAAINASAGRSMRIVSVTPVQNTCFNMSTAWRIAGVAECMSSRIGSRSW
jgi:Na+-transporting methylmalonyl-CoA/oxaloacetate decarboxylase gamma subunit